MAIVRTILGDFMVFGSVILGANTDMNGQGEELCTSSGAKYEANPTAM